MFDNNKLIAFIKCFLYIGRHVLYKFARDHVVKALHIAIIELVIIEMIVLLLVLLELPPWNIVLVRHCTLASNRGHWVKVGMHGSNQETGIIGPATHDILGAIVPGNASL